MRAQLSYRPRDGIVSGFVAGRLIRLPTQRHDTRITTWEKTQEVRSGKVTLWDHTFEIPHKHLDASPARWAGNKLTVVENGTLDIYDWPGEYAQRFDGVDKPSGSSGALLHHEHHGRLVHVREGGFCLHGMPPCGNPRCIVVVGDWEVLFTALKQTRQVTIVVEL